MSCKKLLPAVLFLFTTVLSFAQLLPFSLEVRGGIGNNKPHFKEINTAYKAGIEVQRITLNIGYEHSLVNIGKDNLNIKNRNMYASFGVRLF